MLDNCVVCGQPLETDARSRGQHARQCRKTKTALGEAFRAQAAQAAEHRRAKKKRRVEKEAAERAEQEAKVRHVTYAICYILLTTTTAGRDACRPRARLHPRPNPSSSSRPHHGVAIGSSSEGPSLSRLHADLLRRSVDTQTSTSHCPRCTCALPASATTRRQPIAGCLSSPGSRASALSPSSERYTCRIAPRRPLLCGASPSMAP